MKPLRTLPSDLIRYKELCEAGTLYEYMMDGSDEDRGAFKIRLFAAVFFDDAHYPSAVRDRFEREFPTVADLLRHLRQFDNCHAAHVMQAYEATLVIATICERIMRERPDLPIITIHDSFLTTEEHVAYVKSVILDEFSKVGVTPKLKHETYAGDSAEF